MRGLLLRSSLLDSIDRNDLIERQKFKLFRVYVLITFLCSSYTGYQAFTTFEGGQFLAFVLWGLSLIFIGCYSLVRNAAQLKIAYMISLLAGCLVLHAQAYSTGGILNTGTIYFCSANMIAYMLLGPRLGHFFTGLGLASVVFLYFASSKFHLADYAMFQDENHKYTDALVTFILGLIFIAGLSFNLHSNKNEVIKQIIHQKEELELKNDQLSRYTDDLERKNSELDKFASIVSHDLKAPLRAIGNLTDWIEQDAGDRLDPSSRSNFDLIKQRVRRMEDLINAILEYSRADRSATIEEQVDVNQVVQDSMDFIGNPAHVSVEVPESLPVIIADRTRINQVFTNLLANAVKYCDKPHVNISVSSKEEEGGWMFSVRDNGPGIDPRFHEKIFVIFQTLQRRDVVESTGVGLAIVKKIIEDQGGKIWVESEPGNGADFRFFWPSARKTTPADLQLAA
ncbi:MAG: sensor histidine kinase [Bacteroidota bacterium]